MVPMPCSAAAAAIFAGASLLAAALVGCSDSAPSTPNQEAVGGGSDHASGGPNAGNDAVGGKPAGNSGGTGGASAGQAGGAGAHAGAGRGGNLSCPYPIDAAASAGAPTTGGAASGAFASLDWTTNAYSDHEKGPPPRENPPEALATPKNGAEPSSHGFAFDIDGQQLTWRWGPSIIKAEQASLEMYCSEDGAKTFKKLAVGAAGTGTIPCTTDDYGYFFRYKNPGLINTNPASVWVYTGYFTLAGERVDVHAYAPFTDGSANWMRFRHPVTTDGVTAAILDAQHNNDELKHLDRYAIWVDDAPGKVQLGFGISGNVLRVESMTRADHADAQQFFAVNQNPGFDDAFSYGQVVSFEITAVAGRTGAQTYNDFSHYTIGYGWSSKYGDPRLQSAGKASTSQLFSSSGQYSELEHNAIFTQPLVTIHDEDMIDDFIVGHHLFHGIDPKKRGSSKFDDVKVGSTTCGHCHFRDGRGSEVIQTAKGPRLPPPTYGVKLLEAIECRQTGFSWDGSAETVATQVKRALVADHGVKPEELPGRVLELLTAYTEALTVPSRDPGTYDIPGVAEGEQLFEQVGCARCHTPVQRTSSQAPTHLRNLVIRPYTDMQVWNVNGGSYRTAPLWGLGHNLDLLERNGRATLFMHDGASTSLEAAIQAHDGDASPERAAYDALTEAQRKDLVKFVSTL